MGRDGFSLIELLAVMGIMAILLGLATLNFNNWLRRSNIEKEVKELYSDMMFVRQQALVTGLTHEIQFASASRVVFRRYSSEHDAVGTVVRTRDLPYAIEISAPSETELTFNSRGMLVETTPKSVCVFSKCEPPLDSIYITQSRINMGKIINQGAPCAQANITLK